MKELPRDVPLFRREVILHRASTVFGGILLPQPPIFAWMAWLAGLCAVGLLLVIFLGSYPQRVHATGWLAPVQGLARVASTRPGTVAEVYIGEGAAVSKGDLLVTVTTARVSSESPNVEGEVVGQLRNQLDALRRQIAVERDLADAESRKVERQISDAREEIEQLNRQVALAQERLRIASGDHDRVASLVGKGLLPRAELSRADEAVLVARLSVETLRQQILERNGTTNAMRAELASTPKRLAKRVAELEIAAGGLEREITEARSAEDSQIRAPISGHVIGVSVRNGQSVLAGEPLLTVVPSDATLQAELLVPTRGAGLLQPGMPVKLRYDAFPFPKFGQYSGVVRDIAHTAVVSDQHGGPIKLSEPAYVVNVTLERQTVVAYGSEVALQAGLTVQADIVQHDRRIIEWMLEPLYALRQGA